MAQVCMNYVPSAHCTAISVHDWTQLAGLASWRVMQPCGFALPRAPPPFRIIYKLFSRGELGMFYAACRTWTKSRWMRGFVVSVARLGLYIGRLAGWRVGSLVLPSTRGGSFLVGASPLQ